jgi:hypothetical protein
MFPRYLRVAPRRVRTWGLHAWGRELLAGLWTKMAESAILLTLMKLREWARKQGMMGTRRDLSFCACLYGHRLARNRAERAVEALQCASSRHSASS